MHRIEYGEAHTLLSSRGIGAFFACDGRNAKDIPSRRACDRQGHGRHVLLQLNGGDALAANEEYAHVIPKCAPVAIAAT